MYNVDDKITFKIKVNNEIVSFTGRVNKNRGSHKYYLFFNSDHRETCTILKSSIPTFFDIAKTYDANTDTIFPEFDTLEQLELFIKAISVETSKELNKELIQTKITKNNDKIRLQRKKASISRGTVSEGSGVRSGKCKITAVFGHLSNKACYC